MRQSGNDDDENIFKSKSFYEKPFCNHSATEVHNYTDIAMAMGLIRMFAIVQKL